ncbi:CapA family protein [Micromonospora sp. NPDC049679]|uniref:CapA family protein n=1 Tax=Micromonospora sp. NPDC049679 TaxID=3155920 RepID=UPI0034066337
MARSSRSVAPDRSYRRAGSLPPRVDCGSWRSPARPRSCLLPVDVAVPRWAPAAAPDPGEITLAFAGDVHFVDRTLKLLDDPAAAFGPIASTLSAADVTMVNLETPAACRSRRPPTSARRPARTRRSGPPGWTW